MNENKYLHLKSGTDIRGTAVDGVPGEELELTDEAVFDLTVGFCKWLSENGYNKNNMIAICTVTPTPQPSFSGRKTMGAFTTNGAHRS